MTGSGYKGNCWLLCLFAVLATTVALGAVAGTPVLRAADVDLASIVRGGRLYDNWIEELKESRPLLPHPSYPTYGKFANDAKATWLCKECHGWDYLGRLGAYAQGEHFTGIVGIEGMAGAASDGIVAVLTDDIHRYDSILFERDLENLANFVGRGQVNMDKYIDRITKAAKGEAIPNKVFFDTICANCHGKDGQKFRHRPSLRKIASENPWEAFHKILNGHPGETMPALRAFNEKILVGILAYAQTLPKEEALVSIVRGGRLYDNWYAETGQPKPRDPHPAYPAQERAVKLAGATWRCKECHGWDYRGRTGAYSKGPHYTGIKGIRRAAGMDPDEIIDVISDSRHGYSTVLSERDLRDLANFVSMGQVDMDRHIDRKTLTAKGDKDSHVAFFTTICTTCHGPRGLKIITMQPLGQVAMANPWAALHMLLNGHPAEEMPALRALETDVLVDILTYIQTLPTQR